jgi:tetratricopeptide (TPR) repeat protein
MMGLLLVLSFQAPQATQFEAARQLELRGHRDEARRVYSNLLDQYNRGGRFPALALTAFGAAAERLSYYEPRHARDALTLYDAAAAADPNDPDPQLRAAALLFARYNVAEARTTWDQVRRRWPSNARAMLGQAQVRRFLGENPVPLTDSALIADPRLVEARVFRAQLAMDVEDYARADSEVARALALAPHAREALATRAALAAVQGDSTAFREVDRTIAADDPHAAEHLVSAGEAVARGRRYADAVRFGEVAVARDSQSWKGWALLGTNRLRRGDMSGGRAALERALAGDPFDLWTKNTLDLLDTLRRFPGTSSAHFRFVMDAGESALLALYAPPLAEEAYQKMAARYGIRPAGPIRVEIYPNHADFSVRTVGLAGLGALGACFGPVIVMDSPSSRDRGRFNWGSTLWHEIAHTFHMELSDYRVPRWLTEGLAVYEERRARPGWGEDVSPEFMRAYTGHELPPLTRLNEVFNRPSTGELLGHAYLMASLAAEYFETLRGADVTPRLLVAFGRGMDTRAVVRQVLGMNPDSLDAQFDSWLRRRSTHPMASGSRAALGADSALYVWPFDPALHERLAAEYAASGDHAKAIRERLAVVALHPSDRAGALYRLALAYSGAGQNDQARQAVLRALEVAPGYPAAQDLLLRLSEGRRP